MMAVTTATDPAYLSQTTTGTFYADLQKATDLEVTTSLASIITETPGVDEPETTLMTHILMDSSTNHIGAQFMAFTASESSGSSSSLASDYSSSMGNAIYTTSTPQSTLSTSLTGTYSSYVPMASSSLSNAASASTVQSASSSSSGSSALKYSGFHEKNTKLKMIFLGFSVVSIALGVL